MIKILVGAALMIAGLVLLAFTFGNVKLGYVAGPAGAAMGAGAAVIGLVLLLAGVQGKKNKRNQKCKVQK